MIEKEALIVFASCSFSQGVNSRIEHLLLNEKALLKKLLM
jgi:hypothetical protein